MRRDPKTGRFLPNPDKVKAPKKPRKKAPKKVPPRRVKGKFVKAEDSLTWHGGKVRKDYILRDRFDPIRETLDSQSEEFGAIPSESILELFAQLSSNKAFALMVTFLRMPGYVSEDTAELLPIPQYCVYVGAGLEFITKIAGWINDGFVIGNIEASELLDSDYLPQHSHPIWSGDSVQSIDGTIIGSGFRVQISGPNKADPYDRKPKRKRKRNYKREKMLAKIRAAERGKKVNKGNRKAQRDRAKERKKAAKQ